MIPRKSSLEHVGRPEKAAKGARQRAPRQGGAKSWRENCGPQAMKHRPEGSPHPGFKRSPHPPRYEPQPGDNPTLFPAFPCPRPAPGTRKIGPSSLSSRLFLYRRPAFPGVVYFKEVCSPSPVPSTVCLDPVLRRLVKDSPGAQAALDALPSSASTTPRTLGNSRRVTSVWQRPS